MNRNTLLLMTLIGLMPVVVHSAEVFPKTKLEKFRTETPREMFKDSLVACHLKALLGETNLKALKNNMETINIFEDLVDGAFQFPGNVPNLFTVSEGFVLIHPDGRMWVANINKEQVDYFTNDRSSLTAPPTVMKEWASRFSEKKWVYSSPKPEDFAVSVKKKCQ